MLINVGHVVLMVAALMLLYILFEWMDKEPKPPLAT